MPGEVAWSKINVTHGGQALSLHNSFVLPKEQRTELAGRDVQYTVNGGVCSICKSNSVQKKGENTLQRQFGLTVSCCDRCVIFKRQASQVTGE